MSKRLPFRDFIAFAYTNFLYGESKNLKFVTKIFQSLIRHVENRTSGYRRIVKMLPFVSAILKIHEYSHCITYKPNFSSIYIPLLLAAIFNVALPVTRWVRNVFHRSQ